MSIVRFRTFRVEAERANNDTRGTFEVTPTWRGDYWAAVMEDQKAFPNVGFNNEDPELAIRDMMKRNGWHVMAVRALD